MSTASDGDTESQQKRENGPIKKEHPPPIPSPANIMQIQMENSSDMDPDPVRFV
jgi:hypothetical protein